LIILLRNRLGYALNGREAQTILVERKVLVDGKVRVDPTFPAGFMGMSLGVITIIALLSLIFFYYVDYYFPTPTLQLRLYCCR
jgi:hypothetical protein